MIKHNLRKKVNDVKEWFLTGRPVLSARDYHVLQVTPDHHQASARKMKLKAAVAAWYVRKMPLKGMFGNIKQEIKSMKTISKYEQIQMMKHRKDNIRNF